MRVYCWALLFSLTLFSACGHSRHVRKTNAKVERKADQKNKRGYVQYSPEEYIDAFKDIAIREMKQHGVPASITLAQALLESGSGNSSLARYANNHFGIKCTRGWRGGKYYKDDDRRNDCFRVYKDAAGSFEDHSAFLKSRRYASLFKLDITDYKGWARGLRKAGYATDPKYAKRLIRLIEAYELDKLDDKKARKKQRRKKQKREKRRKAESQSGNVVYTVRQGDTLYRISQSYGITVEELMRRNKLKSTTIRPGQRLVIK